VHKQGSVCDWQAVRYEVCNNFNHPNCRSFQNNSPAYALGSMKPPIYVRKLSAEEVQTLKEGLRSPNAFRLRRSQILLASAKGQQSLQIAQNLGCADQTVRNAIHAFNHKGLAALIAGSNRPLSAAPVLSEGDIQKLKLLLEQSPRNFGRPSSLWTLALMAEVCFEQEISPVLLSTETIRTALAWLDINWKRAKHWISSPDPAYAAKKNDVSACTN
jgi:transposase